MAWQKENVPEIREAAEAIDAGDVSLYNRLLGEAQEKGVSLANAVKLAESIRKEKNKQESTAAEQTAQAALTYEEIMAGMTSESTQSTYGKTYTTGQLNSLLEDSLETGDTSSALEVRNAMLEQGKTQTSINSSLTRYWKERLQQAYNEGDMVTVRTITDMLERMGMKKSTIQGWTAEKSSLFGNSSTRSTGFGSGGFGNKKTGSSTRSTGFGSGGFGSSTKKSGSKKSGFGSGGFGS
jgi:hypothetical protein